MVIHLALLVLGFALLIKGGDWLVDGASSLAIRLNISDIVIGLTLVSFGTSAPELLVNLYASLTGSEGIALGNVLGSNIANILLVLGAASALRPLTLKSRTIWREIPFALVVTIVLGVLVNDVFFNRASENVLGHGDGIILLILFFVFMYYTYGTSNVEDDLIERRSELGLLKSSIFIVIGCLGLGLGGKVTVDSAIAIATQLGISEELIGLTVMALGTSLPELVTSVTAALKDKSDIAVGNIVGSNIFNILLVLGVSSSLKNIPYDHLFNFDLLVATGATILLFAFMFAGKRHQLDRWKGIMFLIAYFGYIVYTILTR